MTENIVKQVLEIESEADGVIADARQKARELKSSVKKETESLRQELEKSFEGEIESFRAERKQQAEEQIKKIEADADKKLSALESPDPESVSRALDHILKNLKES